MRSPRPEDLQTGDIVLYSGARLWSRIIRAFSRSKWSHVGIVLRYGQTSEPWIVEALEGKGVRFVPFRCWLAWGGEIGHGKWLLPERIANDVTDWCLKRTGQEYASMGQFFRSFGFIWSHVRKLFGIKVDTDSKRYFCSELIASGLFWNGSSIPKHAAKMTPADVSDLPYWKIQDI